MICHLRACTTIGRMEVKVIYLNHIARWLWLLKWKQGKANVKSEDRQSRQLRLMM